MRFCMKQANLKKHAKWGTQVTEEGNGRDKGTDAGLRGSGSGRTQSVL